MLSDREYFEQLDLAFANEVTDEVRKLVDRMFARGEDGDRVAECLIPAAAQVVADRLGVKFVRNAFRAALEDGALDEAGQGSQH